MASRKAGLKEAAPSKARKASRSTKTAKLSNFERPINCRKPRKGIFTGRVFVISGEFEKPHQCIEGWINHQGGRVDKTVTDETTHLICTMEDFKSKATPVKEAWRLGKAKCKIVDIRFIIDCILPKKPKLLSETSYLLAKILAAKRKGRTPELTAAGKGVKDADGSKRGIEPTLHHLFIDRTGFEFKIVLSRTISTFNGKNLEEKFTIYLFESNASPHTYLIAEKYKKANLPAILMHDQSVGKHFEIAFTQFKSIFHEKTGVNWDQRLDKLKQDEQNYVYMPPSGGKPVGVLPHGWKEPNNELELEPHRTAPILEGMVGGDCHMVDPDLMDDTDSGDEAK